MYFNFINFRSEGSAVKLEESKPFGVHESLCVCVALFLCVSVCFCVADCVWSCVDNFFLVYSEMN